MSETNEASPAQAQPSDLERPVRPDCFDFAMDFLGGPEDLEVIAYVEKLEALAGAAVEARKLLVSAMDVIPDYIDGRNDQLCDDIEAWLGPSEA